MKLKDFVSYIVHGAPPRIYATIKTLSPDDKLKGKKIIVTGGGKGLGYYMARKFVSEGAEVLITGRNEITLEKSAKELGCKYLALDIRNVKEINHFISEAETLINGINCLVNNAGISLHENSFLEVTEEQYDAQFDTNLKGSFFLTQGFIRHCMDLNIEGKKKILFISSETSMTVDERPYGLTKASLNSLIQGLACKFFDKDFIINAVAPGRTATDMTGYNHEGDLYIGLNPSKRVYLPEEVAEIASFLLSDVSNVLNGQILYTNEGRTINTRW